MPFLIVHGFPVTIIKTACVFGVLDLQVQVHHATLHFRMQCVLFPESLGPTPILSSPPAAALLPMATAGLVAAVPPSLLRF